MEGEYLYQRDSVCIGMVRKPVYTSGVDISASVLIVSSDGIELTISRIVLKKTPSDIAENDGASRAVANYRFV